MDDDELDEMDVDPADPVQVRLGQYLDLRAAAYSEANPDLDPVAARSLALDELTDRYVSAFPPERQSFAERTPESDMATVQAHIARQARRSLVP